jgi:general secretion pathway protein D
VTALRFTVLLTLVSMALAAVTIVASAPAHAAPRDPAQSYTFAFQDADISQVAQAILGDSLGLTYAIDPAVTGKMSFRIDRRLTSVQLLAAFEAALETNNVVMVRNGDALTLEPKDKAKGAGRLRTLDQGLASAGYQTVAVPLAYAAPSEVAKALEATGRTDMVVDADDKLGLLILGGTAAELESAVELIHTFDHSGLEDSKIRFFELEQAPADTVATDLDKVLEASGASGVVVVPLRRMNGLFVFARTPEALDEVGKGVARLDVPSQEKTPSLWIYHPKNATAESLANTLNSALNGETQPPPPTGAPAIGGQIANPAGPPGLMPTPALMPQPTYQPQALPPLSPTAGVTGAVDADPVRVGLDRDANTLLIFASPTRWVQIQRILDEIDQPPAQVMIQASIVEVELTSQDNFGIDWSVVGAGGQLGVSSINSPSGAITAETPGFSITFLGKSIKAAVNALGANTKMEVVSEPKVVVLDNHTAKLDVGDQLPVITQTAQTTITTGAPVVNSISYVNTGVVLAVTPRIGGDDKIFLDIDQQVSSGSATTTSTINSPTISTREIQTSLTIPNGGVIALGGLISTNNKNTDSGLPWLKDVPVVGLLFKTTNKSTSRDELIVLLKADVVKDQPSSIRAMTDMLADMREIERRGYYKP